MWTLTSLQEIKVISQCCAEEENNRGGLIRGGVQLYLPTPGPGALEPESPHTKSFTVISYHDLCPSSISKLDQDPPQPFSPFSASLLSSYHFTPTHLPSGACPSMQHTACWTGPECSHFPLQLNRSLPPLTVPIATFLSCPTTSHVVYTGSGPCHSLRCV